MEVISLVLCFGLGYVISSFNPAYLFARSKGIDIKAAGSKNAGASNALILMGKKYGAICAILDIAKAYLAVALAEWLFPTFAYTFPVTATASILGHIFPFQMGFKGGKGLACLGGVFLRFSPLCFLIVLLAELVIVLVTNFICFVPITAAAALPILYGVLRHDAVGAGILVLNTVIIFWKHWENLCRIRQGTELHFSFLWNPQAEAERLESHGADCTTVQK